MHDPAHFLVFYDVLQALYHSVPGVQVPCVLTRFRDHLERLFTFVIWQENSACKRGRRKHDLPVARTRARSVQKGSGAACCILAHASENRAGRLRAIYFTGQGLRTPLGRGRSHQNRPRRAQGPLGPRQPRRVAPIAVRARRGSPSRLGNDTAQVLSPRRGRQCTRSRQTGRTPIGVALKLVGRVCQSFLPRRHLLSWPYLGGTVTPIFFFSEFF